MVAGGTERFEGQDSQSGEQAQFGFRTVRLEEKQGLVDGVFDRVARRYDLMNDLMSGGLHRVWRQILIAMLRPPKARSFHVLDVAGGTGDIAFRICEAGGPQTKVTVLDINGEMLSVGRERTPAALVGRIEFVEANAEELPFPDKSFDAYTIAFGIRNVPRRERALAEAYRVLKRGGRLLVLELGPVDTPGLDRIYDAFSFNVVPAIGRLVTGDGAPYRYLVESIRDFPAPPAFARLVEEAGFRRVDVRALSGGIAAIYSGWKL